VDIRNNARTQQIQNLSGHLYHALSFLRYILYMGWVGIATLVFIPEGNYWVGDANIQVASGNFFLKGLILMLYAFGLLVMLKLNEAFRNLMKQYMKGNIFTEQAIFYVRSALKAGIAVVVISLLHQITGAVYSYFYNSEIDISFAPQIVAAVIYFALMYILLWALEIGGDLNDESINTI